MKSLLICFFLGIQLSGCSPAVPLLSAESKPVKITYKQLDSTQLALTLYYPPNYRKSKKYPAIVFFFGGGWLNGDIRQFERQARYFAVRGMVAALANYRTFKSHKTSPLVALHDAKSAIRYLRQNSKTLSIDPDRIVGAGGSAGGHLAAAADLTALDDPAENTLVSSRPNALVLFNPVFDNGPGGYGHDRIGNLYTAFSPLHNIKRGAAPAIVFLGSQDKLIPIKTAELYKEKMEAAGSRCDLIIYPDQGHGFFNKRDFSYQTIKEADKFLISLGYIKRKPPIAQEAYDVIPSGFTYKN